MRQLRSTLKQNNETFDLARQLKITLNQKDHLYLARQLGSTLNQNSSNLL